MQPVKKIERKRSIDYYYESPLKDKTHTEVSVYYTMGGTSILSGDYTARGIYLSVVPVDYSNVSISRTLFVGYKTLLEGLERFSKSKLEAYKDYLNIDHPMVQDLVEKVQSH
jgi:hypothetical protein